MVSLHAIFYSPVAYIVEYEVLPMSVRISHIWYLRDNLSSP